jgi:hypothetical protein
MRRLLHDNPMPAVEAPASPPELGLRAKQWRRRLHLRRFWERLLYYIFLPIFAPENSRFVLHKNKRLFLYSSGSAARQSRTQGEFYGYHQ